MIEKSTHLYEVLLRFDPQGLAGAHAIFIDVIREDDSILSSVLKQAQPLSAAGVPVALMRFARQSSVSPT